MITAIRFKTAIDEGYDLIIPRHTQIVRDFQDRICLGLYRIRINAIMNHANFVVKRLWKCRCLKLRRAYPRITNIKMLCVVQITQPQAKRIITQSGVESSGKKFTDIPESR